MRDPDREKLLVVAAKLEVEADDNREKARNLGDEQDRCYEGKEKLEARLKMISRDLKAVNSRRSEISRELSLIRGGLYK